MDVLRATMDVMINTCLDGPGAPGVGGTAVALPLMLNGTTNSTVNSDSGPYAVERRQGKFDSTFEKMSNSLTFSSSCT